MRMYVDRATSPEDWEYPCLAVSDSGNVVYFEEEGVGILQHKATKYVQIELDRQVGKRYFEWGMDQFNLIESDLGDDVNEYV